MMTDFKSAEQQVRETLGWRTYCPTAPHEVRVFNLAVSKTAELLEMTAQRDEAQKALEQADKNWQMVFGNQDGQAVIVAKALENDALLLRLESAEATIREQSERIKQLEAVQHKAEKMRDWFTHTTPEWNKSVSRAMDEFEKAVERGKQ